VTDKIDVAKPGQEMWATEIPAKEPKKSTVLRQILRILKTFQLFRMAIVAPVWEFFVEVLCITVEPWREFRFPDLTAERGSLALRKSPTIQLPLWYNYNCGVHPLKH